MTKARLDIFQALPAYFGGKRLLVELLFALLQTHVTSSVWQDTRLLDPFLGGGSVGLRAKHLGFEVVANDVALRSAVIGHGLIANHHVRLTQSDLGRLLGPVTGGHCRKAELQFSPAVFPLLHARLLDRALHNASSFTEPKRSLALLLIIKWALRIQPMSQLRGTDARAAAEGDLDKVSPRRLRHYLDAEKLLRPAAWVRLMKNVNLGVFPGRGEAHQSDVFAFLANNAGDVVYLDPPYPGTSAYEREYAVLDDLLQGATLATSGFSKSAALLQELFKACKHVPVWLVSLNNAALELAEVEDMIRVHRPNLRSLEVPYTHLGSIASKEKNERNREFIILAW